MNKTALIAIFLFGLMASLFSCNEEKGESSAKSMTAMNSADGDVFGTEKEKFPTFVKFATWVKTNGFQLTETDDGLVTTVTQIELSELDKLPKARTEVLFNYTKYLESEVAKLKVLDAAEASDTAAFDTFFTQDTFEAFEIIASIIDATYTPESEDMMALGIAATNKKARAAVEAFYNGFLTEVSDVTVESLKEEQVAYAAAFSKWYSSQDDSKKSEFKGAIGQTVVMLEEALTAMNASTSDKASLVSSPLPLIVVGGYTLGWKTYVAIAAGFAYFSLSETEESVDGAVSILEKRKQRVESDCYLNPAKPGCFE